ncbi:amino acid ABC transporter permease [Pseudochelatococcus sp. B33]
MEYNWHLYIIWDYREVFVRGAIVTAQLTALSLLVSLMVGLPLGIMRNTKSRILSLPAGIFVEFFRSTPTLVQLFWLYYALPLLLGVRLGAFSACVVGLGLHTAAYVAEIFRGGIASIDRGQFLAARAIGMNYMTAMRRIILPQAVRRMIPPFINELANLVKLTTLASTLAVYELMHEANGVVTTTFRPFEIYTALAIAFAALILPMIWLSRWLEKYWAKRS